jgi:glutamate dehydrogenase/leucine dehydrogenase
MIRLEHSRSSQLALDIVDEESNLEAHIVIDAAVNGVSSGGLRMIPDFNPSVLSEVARLKTLKYGFLRIPVGGFKAWIVGDPHAMSPEKKRELLKAFARILRPYLKSRLWILLGADIGITEEDLKSMFASVGLNHPYRTLMGSSGLHVASTVVTAAERATQHLGLDLSRCSVAVEGFGEVGHAVARLFAEEGARVVAVSTSAGAIYHEQGLDVEACIRLCRQMGTEGIFAYRGADRIDKSELLKLDVDVLAPCARHHTIHEKNAGRIAARIVCAGSNLPVTQEAERILVDRNVLCVPDFLANCGGVLGSLLESGGVGKKFIADFTHRTFGDQVTAIMEAADQKGMTFTDYARQIATQRFLAVKKRAEERSIVTTVGKAVMWLHQKGCIRAAVSGPLFEAALSRRLQLRVFPDE